MDEDDELSEVQPDAVPPEVREWLASTFTRQLATSRRRTDEKPKFRSVAHAIRAGIFVDRIYRKVTSAALMEFPNEVVRVLKVSATRYYYCLSVRTARHPAAPVVSRQRLRIMGRRNRCRRQVLIGVSFKSVDS